MGTGVTTHEPAIRLSDVTGDLLPVALDDTRVCYWKQDGSWWIYLPRAGVGRLVNHTIIEHEDGTISVSPSVGLRNSLEGGFARHGYLERGVWREC